MLGGGKLGGFPDMLLFMLRCVSSKAFSGGSGGVANVGGIIAL